MESSVDVKRFFMEPYKEPLFLARLHKAQFLERRAFRCGGFCVWVEMLSTVFAKDEFRKI